MATLVFEHEWPVKWPAVGWGMRATLLSSDGCQVIREYSFGTDPNILRHSEECDDANAAAARGCVQLYDNADGFPMLNGLDQALALMWEWVAEDVFDYDTA